MTETMFTKEEWLKALENLGKTYTVLVPVKKGDFHAFESLEGRNKPDWGFQNTRLSAKAAIFPQSERMFEYTLDKDDPEAHILKEAAKAYAPKAVVGVRPCDAHALQLVKVNFDGEDYKDPWWLGHYEATTLVGLGCNEPCPTCFCTAVGGGPFDRKGLDVLLYDQGSSFLAEALTEKGDALLKAAGEGTEPGKDQKQEAKKQASAAAKKVSAAVSTDQLKGKGVNELFDAPFWDEVAFSCINCGTCTFLCPTCWCFDIQDETYDKQGDRIRNWDSCMFPLFTLHGSGHNPRDKKTQRVRQRFMHKLKYYVDKYENGIQCSGCGRCVRYCPVNIDIREVCEQMNSY